MIFYNRFIVTFEDEKVKIDLIKNNKLYSSFKANLNQIKEVDNFFAQAINGRIIILIKNQEREEIIKIFNNLSKKEALNQAKDLLKSQYSDDKFSALANKDKKYIYYNIKITPFMRNWFDYIMNLNNRIHSIYTVLDLKQEVNIFDISSKKQKLT